MDLPNLCFQRYLIRLRFREDAWFRFYHGSALNAFLAQAFGHPLPSQYIPIAVESGRVGYVTGDPYHFGLTVIGESSPAILPLARLIESACRKSPTGVPIGYKTDVEDIEALPAPALDSDAESISRQSRIRLQFLSPLSMRLTRDGEPDKDFNAEFFDVDHFFKLLWRRLFDLERMGIPHSDKPVDPPPPATRIVSNDLFWVDLPAPKDTPGSARYQGAVGSITIDGDFSEWGRALALAQYVHVGRRSSIGFGQLRVVPVIRGQSKLRPARNYVEKIATLPRLKTALSDVRLSAGGPGLDGVSLENIADQGTPYLENLRSELVDGRYQPLDLLGVVLPKPLGGMRALAIPSVRDRIVQRALTNELRPAVDKLLEDSSYAYRRGLSRHSARDAIERAYNDGFRYILETDIEDFFDSVDWDILFHRIDAYWPDDPMASWIRDWVTAPVIYQGKRIKRSRGVPQGAVISPLLANLYLDQFDEQMAEQGFRLVRYADDLIVACRSRDQVDRALVSARESLAKLGLDLNDEKTRITDFDAGFHYLGFLFLRSMIFDAPASKRDDGKPDQSGDTDIPGNSWLASLDARDLRKLREDAPRRRPKEPLDAAPAGVQGYIFGGKRRVRVEADRIQVTEDDEVVTEYPIQQLSHLIIVGWVDITLPAVMELQQAGVPVFFCDRSGELRSQFDPRDPLPELWLAQAARAENPAFCLEFARTLVSAKLNNQAVHIRRLIGESAESSYFDQLRRLEEMTERAQSLDSLRGIEGRGASLFFECASLLVDDSWGFHGRVARPPGDPVNAMISFGQTILYNHISTALTVTRLMPAIGWYHRRRGRHNALASDLQEPFRPLIDALALGMVRRGRAKLEDFEPSDDFAYPALMTREFRRRFITAVEKRLRTKFRPAEDSDEVSYLEFIHQQCQATRKMAISAEVSFRPLRIR